MSEERQEKQPDTDSNLEGSAARKRLMKIYGEELGQEVWEKLDSFIEEMDNLVRNSEKRIQAAEEKVVHQVKLYFIPLGLLLVGLVMAGMIAFYYSGTKDVNNAVISLQKDIISAQDVIRESADELQQATLEMKAARDDLNIVIADYQEAKAKYEALAGEVDGLIELLKSQEGAPSLP